MLAFQLSITQESLFFGAVQNYQVWDGLIFQSLSDIVYLSSISVVAVTATASISSSRSMLVHLAPPGRSGEFFGLYAIAGTVTVWAGPLLVEIFTTAFNSQRIGMASISMLFLAGLAVLTTVKMEKHA
jgi:UMF1 family MFS transporter